MLIASSLNVIIATNPLDERLSGCDHLLVSKRNPKLRNQFMPNEKLKFYDTVPGFLAAVEEIERLGFFSNIKTEVMGADGFLAGIIINGDGFIPLDGNDVMAGNNPLIDPSLILKRTREQIEANYLTVRSSSSKVETTDWNEFNKEGTKITRKIGSKVSFFLSVTFDFVKQARTEKRRK